MNNEGSKHISRVSPVFYLCLNFKPEIKKSQFFPRCVGIIQHVNGGTDGQRYTIIFYMYGWTKAPLLKREGFLHHDTTTKANILNQQFASVFTEEDMDNLPDLGISPTPEMNKITINTEGVQNLLQHLKPNKATGPDDIPAKFL